MSAGKKASSVKRMSWSSYITRFLLSLDFNFLIMVLSTTPTIEGSPIREYKGIVTGETIIGANVFKDFMAGLRDFFGGRSGTYEKVLAEAKDTSLSEMAERARQMGANAVVGIDLDYETIGQGNSMLMVTCSGTAVVI
jgi:uncharacterized protein YbjQ (UPF0145 family)